MKSSLSTSATQTKIRKVFIGCFCAMYSLSPTLALTPSTGDEKELQKIYTQAREKEENRGAKYMRDAFLGFAPKMDVAIKKDKGHLAKFFGEWYCDGCDSIISPDLDQALIDYLATVPALTKTQKTPYDFISVIKPHLDPSISEFSNSDVRALNTLMNMMTDSIIGQVKEQMILSREIAPMGLYYDWDTDNSPRDIMHAFRDVDSLLFAEVPRVWAYKNTSAEEEDALITGTGWISGEWSLWLSRWISDAVARAFGMTSSSGKWVAATTTSCWINGCDRNRVNVYKNTHSNSTSGGDTMEEIFKRWKGFFAENANNRSNRCITAPTINLFQSTFSQSANLWNMLSNRVSPVKNVPELLKWFMNRESRTRKFEDREIDDSIARTMKKRWINPEKPTEILIAGMERAINQTSRGATDNDVGIINTVYALERWGDAYQQYLKYVGKGMEGTFLKWHDLDSWGIIEVAMEEMASRARFMNESAINLATYTNYLSEKPDCPVS